MSYATYLECVLISRVFEMVRDQVDSLDRNRLQYLAFTARGCFAPLCAFLGGVVAQEALKALTGKFTPVNQWVSIASIRTFSITLISVFVTY